jgi:hypothetical protein
MAAKRGCQCSVDSFRQSKISGISVIGGHNSFSSASKANNFRLLGLVDKFPNGLPELFPCSGRRKSADQVAVVVAGGRVADSNF